MNLAKRHITFFRDPERRPGADLTPVSEVVSERVWRAMKDASAHLTALGVKHVLVGGLAVGAHGWPRATGDVNFLVDDNAWIETEGGLVLMRAGMPVQAHGVSVDTLSVRENERHLLAAIGAPEVSEGVPVAPIEALVYLKLVSPRSKDRQDVVELLRTGADAGRVRQYLDTHAPHLREKFEAMVRSAEEEED